MQDYSKQNFSLATDYTSWLEGIIDSINDGVLVIDSRGIVQFINKEYTEITGVRRNKIIGRYLIDVRKGAVLPKTLRDGKRRSGIQRKEGNNRYIVDMAPIYIRGKKAGAVSVLKSLNEVHDLAKELEKNQEKLGKLEKTMGQIYKTSYTFDDIVGGDDGLKESVNLSKKAAHSNLNILIQGESGTGKELFAHAIHHESPRSNHPFVPVNCAAIPTSLLETELFGYEEGTFTDSKKGGKIGLFELAHLGTLFLDEIGDMPLELQAKLLRVLQDGRIRKVGSLAEQALDVQVITATNKDLENMVKKDKFREDLYYRLNGIQIAIPPLRKRKNDLNVLINHLLSQEDISSSLTLTSEAREVLQQYDWPGNTRELFNVIQYGINMIDNEMIELQHLPEPIRKQGRFTKTFQQETLKDILLETEQAVIQETLENCGHTLEGKKKAANKLGISLATLYNKINNSSR
ncbi:sigma-54 interaction domain-containing protein [Lentibacillus jeotgali]|uniref:sigma-54 interaction domain-containing protein n=1 Tax=Lentibacillus jeotgali TaxID=558169 RepID=UPI0002627454|nr:sigma 54-interacting transcriptional regulator [Lentibacillus jeotgali]